MNYRKILTDAVFTVVNNDKVSDDVYKLTLFTEEFLKPKCGQFINIKVPNRGDLILRRPFAIAGFDEENKTIFICYKVVGSGTNEFTKLKKGDNIKALYPLGNYFQISSKHKKIAIIGGGVGIFPLLSVLRQHNNTDKEFYSFLGFRNKQSAIFLDEFKNLSADNGLFVCTDDCSFGENGLVTDMFLRHIEEIKPDLILTCGPKPMLISVQKLTENIDIPTLVSLEERMGCGMGACIVCTCKIKDNQGQVNNKRVCRDGPIFNINEVVL